MRRNGIFFGVVIILAGALMLPSTGCHHPAYGVFFWPLVFVLLGVWFQLRPVQQKNQPTILSFQNPPRRASRGEIGL